MVARAWPTHLSSDAWCVTTSLSGLSRSGLRLPYRNTLRPCPTAQVPPTGGAHTRQRGGRARMARGCAWWVRDAVRRQTSRRRGPPRHTAASTMNGCPACTWALMASHRRAVRAALPCVRASRHDTRARPGAVCGGGGSTAPLLVGGHHLGLDLLQHAQAQVVLAQWAEALFVRTAPITRRERLGCVSASARQVARGPVAPPHAPSRPARET